MSNKLIVQNVQTIIQPAWRKQYAQNISSVLKNTPGVLCRISKTTDDLSLHHVVPRWIIMYAQRKHYKFQTVVLNRDIHDEYERLAESLRDRLLNDIDIKYKGQARHLPIDHGLRAAQKAARIILEHSYDISIELLQNAHNYLLEYLDLEFIDREKVRDLLKIPNKIPNAAYIEYGKKLIKHYGILNLEHIWTKHYLEFENSQLGIYQNI
jgi:hypothetical protein